MLEELVDDAAKLKRVAPRIVKLDRRDNRRFILTLVIAIVGVAATIMGLLLKP